MGFNLIDYLSISISTTLLSRCWLHRGQGYGSNQRTEKEGHPCGLKANTKRKSAQIRQQQHSIDRRQWHSTGDAHPCPHPHNTQDHPQGEDTCQRG